jgi:hypothetical protein
LRTERGLTLGIALVVAMACGALALGLGGAFSDVPCSANGNPARLTVHIAPAIPDQGRLATVYRMAPPTLGDADAARFAAALGLGTPRATALGWKAGSRSQVGSLEVTHYPFGWSVDAQPTRRASAPFAARSEQPGSRATARRAAIEALATFGVDAASWRVDVSRVLDRTAPVRFVELAPPLPGAARDATAFYEFAWSVGVWDDGSVRTINGVMTTFTAIPIRLDSPRAVLRGIAASRPDPYRVDSISMAPDRRGDRIRIGPVHEDHSRTTEVELRCTGTTDDVYSYISLSSGGGFTMQGAAASRPAPFDAGTDMVFAVAHVQRAFTALVVASPSANEAFLVPTYFFSGRSNLTQRDGSPAGYAVTQLAVRADRIVTRSSR